MEESLAGFHRAGELEPRSALIAEHLGLTYGLTRNAAQAERYFDRAISLRPDWASPYFLKAWYVHLLGEGNTERARAVLEQARDVVVEH